MYLVRCREMDKKVGNQEVRKSGKKSRRIPGGEQARILEAP